jgi:ABC-type transport system involved in multi-copper enzyme maturation permease subunit
MWSRTLALFFRALRVDSRALPSHLMRVALLAFVGLMLMQAQFFAVMMGAPGFWFFQALSWINFCFATLAATFLFASSITEEKEERTLGLLRMADVGPLPLLLGKSAPRMVAALLILCVQFPFTLLAITLGGVTWGQVAAAFCTLVSHIVLVGGLALLFSVIFRRTGTAIGLTFLIMLSLILIPPFLLAVFSSGQAPAEIQPFLKYLLPPLQAVVDASAAPRLWDILTTGFDENPIGLQVLSNLGAGAILFALAWVLFDPCNRNLDDEPARTTSVVGLISRKKGPSRRAWRLAIVGKDFRSLAGGWRMLIVKLVAYLLLVGLIVFAFDNFRWSSVDSEKFGEVMTSMTLFFLLPLESMVIAARLFRTEIKDRTWPMLLSLPLSLPEIAYAKLAGALFALFPCAFCFCVGIVLNGEDFADTLADILQEPAAICGFAVYFAHLLLFVHLTTLFSVLSNAWAGALLAMVTSFMGIWVNYAIVLVPIMILTLSSGGPSAWGSTTVETYFAVGMGVSAALIVLLTGCVHFLIGVRLKSAAAQ